MAKQIRFEYKGEKYVLEFTRRSVERLEREGFKLEDIVNLPVTRIPQLFAASFWANHRHVRRDLVDEIYDSVAEKSELLNKLAEMYNEPIQALFDDEAENEGNVKWEASW